MRTNKFNVGDEVEYRGNVLIVTLVLFDTGPNGDGISYKVADTFGNSLVYVEEDLNAISTQETAEEAYNRAMRIMI